MDKEGKIVLLICGITILTSIIFFRIMYVKSVKTNLEYEFSGIVENVVYDAKDIPEVTVKKKSYYLADEYVFDHKIQKGDSLKKKKGSVIYMLIKRQTKEHIEFTN